MAATDGVDQQELDRIREANIRQGAALRAAEAERDGLREQLEATAAALDRLNAEAEIARVGELKALLEEMAK